MAEGRAARVFELVDEAIRSASLETHTALPGRITSYDEATQKATIQLQLQREYENEAGIQTPLVVPELLDVPVLFPRAGGFVITFPIGANEPCLVIFTERDLSGWMQLGAQSVPPSSRRHSYSDAVAILGLSPSPDALSPASDTSNLVIRSDDNATRIEVGAGGIEITTDGASGHTINASAGPVTVDASGAFTVDAGGAITLTRGPSELLTVLSAVLTVISGGQDADSTPWNAATISAINVQIALIEAMKA